MPVVKSPIKSSTESQIPKYVPKKYKARIEFWDDERSLGNSLIVSLFGGWRWTHGDVDHVSGFDTVAAALAALRLTRPCDCETCRKNLQSNVQDIK